MRTPMGIALALVAVASGAEGKREIIRDAEHGQWATYSVVEVIEQTKARFAEYAGDDYRLRFWCSVPYDSPGIFLVLDNHNGKLVRGKAGRWESVVDDGDMAVARIDDDVPLAVLSQPAAEEWTALMRGGTSLHLRLTSENVPDAVIDDVPLLGFDQAARWVGEWCLSLAGKSDVPHEPEVAGQPAATSTTP